MLASGFDYELTEELIAQRPPDNRHDSRLLVLSKSGIVHSKFTSLSNYLEAGDALILNDTKVIPARLRGRKSTGGAVELLLVEGAACRWRCMARGPGLKTGTRVIFGEDVSATLGERNGDFREVTFNKAIDADGLMGRIGEAPTPPYIKERLVDGNRYQTVYASEPGSIAAPTAGLHFTREMLGELDKAGVIVQRLTLKIGPGTFLPLRNDTVEEHLMHEEHVHLTPQTADVLNRVRREGGKWCAVGTSTVRALESACSRDGMVSPMDAPTGLFIYPGYEFNSRPELLLTNFHLPRSTNLLLACAYGGTGRVIDAYREAVGLRYRFYSFGDAMLAEGDFP